MSSTSAAPVAPEGTPSGGSSIAIAVVQLILIPVLAVVGFGFFFVGFGLSPDSTGDVLSGQDVLILVLYGIVALTVLILLIGAPTLLIARSAEKPNLARKAARIPLMFAGVSVLILLGLAIAGFVFNQVAAV